MGTEKIILFARMLAERWLRPEVARFVACVTLAIAVILVLIMFATVDQNQTAFGTSLGLDYGEFQVVGEILNEGQGSRLYDLDLQDERLHQLLPKLSKDEHLPFVYPPFLALIFQPLAKLPYVWSFATWLVVTVGLYAGSVALIGRSCSSIDRTDWTTCWLLALSFPPFSMECCLGGQISAIGCFVLAASRVLDQSGKLIASGFVLSLLLYKPTLLILIGPMLVISRAWKTLVGFAAGASILVIVSWVVVGQSGCLDFVGLMAGYGRSGGSVGQGFKTIKYVDLTAFLRLLGVRTNLCRPLAMVLGFPIFTAMVIAWWKSVRGRFSDFTWAATIVLTPVLNIYGPIYDVSLVVPGVLIGANSLKKDHPEGWPVWFRWLLALLYVSALVSQPLAQKLGLQTLTMGLLAVGGYFLTRSLRDRPVIVGWVHVSL